MGEVCHAGVGPSALPVLAPSDTARLPVILSSSEGSRSARPAVILSPAKDLALPAFRNFRFAIFEVSKSIQVLICDLRSCTSDFGHRTLDSVFCHSPLVTSIFNNSFLFINIMERTA